MTEIVVRAAEGIDKNIIIEMLQSLQDYEHALHPGRRPGADVAEFRYKRITDAAESFNGAVLVAIEKSEIVGLTAGWMIIDEDHRLSINTLARNGPAITASRAVGFEPFEVKLEKFIGN